MLFYQQNAALRESLLQQKASSVQDDLDFLGDDGVQIMTSPPPEVPEPPVPSDQGVAGPQIPSSPPVGPADPKRAVSGPFQPFFDASEQPDDAKLEQEVQRRVYDEEQKLKIRYEDFFDKETEKVGLLKADLRKKFNELVDKRKAALDGEYDAKLTAERDRLRKAHTEQLEQLQRSSADNVKTAVDQNIQQAVDGSVAKMNQEFDLKLATAVQERVQARESQFDLRVKHEVERRLSSQPPTVSAPSTPSGDIMTQLRALLKLVPNDRRHEASSMFFQEIMAPGLMAGDQAAAQPTAAKGDQPAEGSGSKEDHHEKGEGLALTPRITTPVVNPSLDYLSKLGRQHVDTAGRLHIQQVIATTKTTAADRAAMKKSMPDIRMPMHWAGHRDGSAERPASTRPAVQRLAAIWSHRLSSPGVMEYLVSLSGMPPSWMSEDAVKRENPSMLTIYTAANLDFEESEEDQENERKRRAGESGPRPDDVLGD